MTPSWSHWCKKFALTISGAITLTGCFAIASQEDCALAQIIPDSTLGNQNSTVTSTGTVDQLDGGVTKGTNLFHSFQEFNIGNGRSAFFSNPSGIENILSRVTGANPSNILGTLGVSGGNANLFLINPNGIIFGQNASLSLNGSFVATTANAIGLVNGNIFSANPVEPLPSQLLNVNPNVFFFNQIAAQPIINRSTANSTGLQVPQGQSLLMVGGAVRLEGGQMQAPGGRVELGGVAGTGSVGLNVNGNDLRLSFPVGVQQADVSLDNRAVVDVRAGGGGSIAINAQNLNLTQGSKLKAGIASGLGLGDTQAGNIEINSTGNVSFDGEGSGAYNQVELNAIGNVGDINVTAGSLSLTNGGELNTSTWGQGNGGNVNVYARDTVSFVGESPKYSSSGAYSRVEKTGVGQGGDIYIKTGSLFVSDGAFLGASTFGIGDAGNITIDARDTVSFVGEGPDSFPSGAYTQVTVGARGQGGNVNLTTGSLLVTNGAQLNTSTRGLGNAGKVNVYARDTVSFVGESPNYNSSGAYSRVEVTGVGQGGDIYIKTGSLLVSDGAFLGTNTRGQGNAGNLTIDARDTVSFVGAGPPDDDFYPSGAYTEVRPGARGQGGDIYISTGSLWVTGGAFLSARSLGIGDAGNVTINARDTVSFDGVGRSPIYPYLGSGAYSQVDETGVGQAGDIYISTGSLEVTAGAYLSAGTLGIGNAGNVTINARDKVSFDGVGTNGISSGAYGQARLFNTQGQGGNVNITAGSLSVTNGAVLSSSTYGQKNAGNVNINVRDKVSFDGVGTNGQPSSAASRVEKDAGGNGGSVNITTGSLSVTNGAVLIVSTFGQGNAGDLIINARNTIQLDNQSRIAATTIVGNKGNIFLRSQNLVLLGGSNITTNATGTATGGNITIDTDILAALENSDITANADVARGGQVIINTQGIIGTQFRDALTPESDITATGGSPELSGTVEINTQNVDPNAGLFALPVQPADTELAQGCQAGGGQDQSKFVVTGRGGLPPNPKEALSSDDVFVNWIPLAPEGGNPSSPAVSAKATNTTQAPLVEAQGWVMNNKGQVVLTASALTVTPHSPWQTSNSCGTAQSEARSGD
jgi:filamentous hemagglutinin family protein